MPSPGRRLTVALFVLLISAAAPASAVLIDEIQVYADDINAPGETGLEVHVNTTPRGRTTPSYPGEVVSHHGWRLTPELSYGIASDWEAGLYLPVSHDPSGDTRVAGVKLRLKWLPLRSDEGRSGAFLGANALPRSPLGYTGGVAL